MTDRDGAEAAHFLESADGRIAFTAEGRDYFASYFAYAGIDIRRIRTRADLDRARRQAFPFFFDYMVERLKRRPQTLETRALLAVVAGDWDAYERAFRQLKTRERLTVVSAASGEPPAPG
jgi:hypothetical protein